MCLCMWPGSSLFQMLWETSTGSLTLWKMSWADSPQSLTEWRVLWMIWRMADSACLSGPYRGSTPASVRDLHWEHRGGLLRGELSLSQHWSERGGEGHRDHRPVAQWFCLMWTLMYEDSLHVCIFLRRTWLYVSILYRNLMWEMIAKIILQQWHAWNDVWNLFILTPLCRFTFCHKVGAFIKSSVILLLCVPTAGHDVTQWLKQCYKVRHDQDWNK